jgi:desulfoferrodoxin (superoxide reductase-like protein)
MQTFFRVLAASVAFATCANAVPTIASFLSKRTNQADLLFNCDVSELTPYLPKGQENITVPAYQKTRFITAGVGVQNYTCSDAGAFVSAGAVASLYDVSCIAHTGLLPHIQELLFDAATAANAQSVVDVLLLEATLKISDHYFSPGAEPGKIVPVFDFTHSLKDKNQFVDVKKIGSIPSPDGKEHIDWLNLETVSGAAAKTVFRLNTHLGQPPASCKSGEEASIPYSAQYWFLE